MASAFPKLPGFVPTQDIDKTSFKRVSAVKQDKNRDVKSNPAGVYPLPRQRPVPTPDQTGAFNPKYLSTTHSTYKPLNGEDVLELFQPSWVKMDRHVLRFYGFFKESVMESNLENYRIRKLIIYFYLEDNSVSITEPKQNNAGIPQGPFLKRQKVLKRDGTGIFLSPFDFRIGEDVDIFGKAIRINDCDQYTREFFENLNDPQPGPFEAPTDAFETTKLTKHVPQKDHSLKEFIEHKLGGGRPTPQKQFLENDRKVLRFFVFSDNPYIMHYYLADDTIDIREINFPNSGKDPFPLLLKRQRLPKRFSLGQPGQTVESEYIRPEDVKFGGSLEVYGRRFHIQGCDPFTQDYLRNRYGIDFPLGNVEATKMKDGSNIVIPPYNGFGDEEDSLGYVYRLIPKVPKKDYFKWMDNQNHLRVISRLNTKVPEDIDRRFIITFFLHDDSLLIYEPAQRNSGIMEGKFLEKGKYKNVDRNNEYFNPTDLVVGRDIKINGYSFQILDCDEFTKKWFAENLVVAQDN